MKKINSYITEKLLLNNTVSSKVDIDDLTGNDVEVLYSYEWDNDDDSEDNYEYCQDKLDEIDKDCETGFICTKFVPLGKIKDPTSDKHIYDVNYYLSKIIDSIITGKDQGYVVCIKGGHLEIDCVNSGSGGTYYIYQCSAEAWDNLSAWWEGDDDIKSFSFLYAEGSIVPIKIN